VAYGIAGDATGLPEGGGDVRAGTNSLGEQRYNGPAPPAGHGTLLRQALARCELWQEGGVWHARGYAYTRACVWEYCRLTISQATILT
jgi:phosphatidylethanolamine-binding protein (PEBP) family uncharacterized protein